MTGGCVGANVAEEPSFGRVGAHVGVVDRFGIGRAVADDARGDELVAGSFEVVKCALESERASGARGVTGALDRAMCARASELEAEMKGCAGVGDFWIGQ